MLVFNTKVDSQNNSGNLTLMLKLSDIYRICFFKKRTEDIIGQIMKISYLFALDKMIRKPAGSDLVVSIIGTW